MTALLGLALAVLLLAILGRAARDATGGGQRRVANAPRPRIQAGVPAPPPRPGHPGPARPAGCGCACGHLGLHRAGCPERPPL